MTFTLPPDPIEETIEWCKKHRPDCVEHLEEIDKSNNPQVTAIHLMMALAFASGRRYQITNPDAIPMEPDGERWKK